MHVQAFELMVFEKNPQTPLEQHDPLHQETDVELLVDLFTAFVELAHEV